METRPTQSQTFNINGVSSPKDSASGQCGSETFYAHTKSSHGEGITVLKSLLCLAKAHAQEFIKKGSWTQICAQIKSLLGYVVDNLAHLFLLSKNQTANVLFKRPGFSTSYMCVFQCVLQCVCVCACVNSTACLSQKQETIQSFMEERRQRRGRERPALPSGEINFSTQHTHPHSPPSSSSSVASPVTHVGPAQFL